jgi:CBS-domain-containing membrane protein
LRLYLVLIQDVMDKSFLQLYKGELATKARTILRGQDLRRIIFVLDDNKSLVGMVSRDDVMTMFSVSPIWVRGIILNSMLVRITNV